MVFIGAHDTPRALIAMCVLAALFFLRYWRVTKDRFFIWLA
jgi:hypothetical protein